MLQFCAGSVSVFKLKQATTDIDVTDGLGSGVSYLVLTDRSGLFIIKKGA